MKSDVCADNPHSYLAVLCFSCLCLQLAPKCCLQSTILVVFFSLAQELLILASEWSRRSESINLKHALLAPNYRVVLNVEICRTSTLLHIQGPLLFCTYFIKFS